MRNSLIICIVFLLFICVPINVDARGSNTTPSSTANGKAEMTLEINKKGQLVPIYKGQQTTAKDGFNFFLEKYRYWISGFSALGALSMILLFIVNFMRLGKDGDNSILRLMAIKRLIGTAIATALFGSVTLVTTLFYNALF